MGLIVAISSVVSAGGHRYRPMAFSNAPGNFLKYFCIIANMLFGRIVVGGDGVYSSRLRSSFGWDAQIAETGTIVIAFVTKSDREVRRAVLPSGTDIAYRIRQMTKSPKHEVLADTFGQVVARQLPKRVYGRHGAIERDRQPSGLKQAQEMAPSGVGCKNFSSGTIDDD